MLTVLLENRQPAKTMAWLLVLAFVPVVGIILYIFFGQNIRKEFIINRHTMDRMTRKAMLEVAPKKDSPLIERHQTLMRLFANQSFALPMKNNEVEFYTQGKTFFPVLKETLRNARHHIHLSTYIIENDPLGNSFADVLIERAQAGVEVRVIYDDVGCWKVRGKFFKRMKKAGVDIRPFMPVHFPMLTGKINYRNHRKICVVDGQVGFIGGMNIAQRYLEGTKRGPWRDTHLKVVGDQVHAMQRTFLEDWYFVSRSLLSDQKYYPPSLSAVKNDCMAQIVTSSPTSQWASIMQGYVRILLEARHYVYMETPYFLPTDPVLFAMRTAALSGVDVRLMIPRHGDAKIVEWASRSFLPQVLRAGVKVYFYEDGFNHSKLLVCDDCICTCGSTNLDFRSFENNFEANMFIYDEAAALQVKRIFSEDQHHCTLIKSEQNLFRRPFLHRFVESFFRLLSPLL